MRRSALHLCTLAAVVLLSLRTTAHPICTAAPGTALEGRTGGQELVVSCRTDGECAHYPQSGCPAGCEYSECRDCPVDTHNGQGGLWHTAYGCVRVKSDVHLCLVYQDGFGTQDPPYGAQEAVTKCRFDFQCYHTDHEDCPAGCDFIECDDCPYRQRGLGGLQGTSEGCQPFVPDCPPGKEAVRIQPYLEDYYYECFTCNSGKYSAGGDIVQSCEYCPAGQEPTADKSSCVTCSVGKYRDPTEMTDDGFCKDCPGALIAGQHFCCLDREAYDQHTHQCTLCQDNAAVTAIGCQVCPSNTIYTGTSEHFGTQTRTKCEICPIIDDKQSYRSGDQTECHVCVGASALNLWDADGNLIEASKLNCFFTPFWDPARPAECSNNLADYEDIMHYNVNIQCHACPLGQETSYSSSYSAVTCQPCAAGYYRDEQHAECEMCPAGTTSSQYNLPNNYPSYTNQMWATNKNIFFRGYHNGFYTVADYCDFAVNVQTTPSSDAYYITECQKQNMPNPQYCVPCRQGFFGQSGICVECSWKKESVDDRTDCTACLPSQMNHGHTIARLQTLIREDDRTQLQQLFNPGSSSAPSDIFLHNNAAREVMQDYVWQYHISARNDGDPSTFTWSDTFEPGESGIGYANGFVNHYGLAYANVPWQGDGPDPRPADSVYKENVIRVCCSDETDCDSTCVSDHSSYEIPLSSKQTTFDYATVMRVYRDLTIADIRDVSGVDLNSNTVSYYDVIYKSGLYRCTQYVWKGGVDFVISGDPNRISEFETVTMQDADTTHEIEWCDVLPVEGCECFEGYGFVNAADTTCTQCPRHTKSDRHSTVCEPCGVNSFNYGRDAANRDNYDDAAYVKLGKTLPEILLFNRQNDVRFESKHAFYDRICLTCPVGYKIDATPCEDSATCVYNMLSLSDYPYSDASTQMCVPACSLTQWPMGIDGDRTSCDYTLNANQVITGEYFARRIVCAAGSQPKISSDGSGFKDCTGGLSEHLFLTTEFCVDCEDCPDGHYKSTDGLQACMPCSNGDSAGESWARNSIFEGCGGTSQGLVTCGHGYYGDAASNCLPCPHGESRTPADSAQQVTSVSHCSQCQAPTGRNNANLRCEPCNLYQYSNDGMCKNCGKQISNGHPLVGGNGDACVSCEDVSPCLTHYTLEGCGDPEYNSVGRGEGMGTCVRDACPAGHFLNVQTDLCQQCEQGKYMSTSGYQTSCNDCSATEWSGVGATSCKHCDDPKQYVNQDGNCESCCEENESEFKLRITGTCEIVNSRLQSASTCTECELGTYLNSDKSNCVPCPDTEPFTDPSKIDIRNIDSCMAKVCSETDFSQDVTWTSSLTQTEKNHVLANTLYYTPVDITAYQSSSISSSSAQTYLDNVQCKVMTPCPDGTGLSGTSATHGGLRDSLCSGCRFGYRSIGDKYPMECVRCSYEYQHTGPNRNKCIDCPQVTAEAFDTNVYAYVFSPGLTFQQYTEFLGGFGDMHVCLCALGSFWDEATQSCITCEGQMFFSVRPKTLQWFKWYDHLYDKFALYPHRRNNPSFDHNTRHVTWTQRWHDWFSTGLQAAPTGLNGCRLCGSNSAINSMAVDVKWSVDDNICRCDPNHAEVGGQCVLCGADEYVQRDAAVVFQGNYYESTQCKSCSCSSPLQTFTNTCGGETAPDCRCRAGTEVDSDGICHMCPPGQYGDTVDGPCQSCAPGTYNSYHGSTVCTTCPADSYCATGATQPTECHPTRESEQRSSSISACQCRAGFTPVAGQEECNLEQGACPVNTYSTLSTTCTALCEDPTKAGTADCTAIEHDLLYTANRAINTDIYASCSGACASDYLIEVLHARIQQDNLAHGIDRHEGLIAAANTTHWFYFDRGFSTYWYPDDVHSSQYTHSELIYVDDTGTQHTDRVDLRNMHRRYVEKTSSWDSWSVVFIPAPSFKDMLNTQTQAYVYVSHYTEEEDGRVRRDRRGSGCTELLGLEQIPSCTSRLRVFVNVQPGAPEVSSCPGSVIPEDQCTTGAYESGDIYDLSAGVCYDGTCGAAVRLQEADLPEAYDLAEAGSFTPAQAQDCARHPQSVLIAPLLGGYVDAADAVTNAAHSTLQFGSTAAEHLLYWSNVRKTVLSLQLFDVKGFIVEFGSVDCGGQIQRRVIVDTSSAPASGSCTGTLKMDVTYGSSAAASIAMAHIVRVEPSLSAVQLRARAAAFTKVHVGAFSAWNSLVDIQRVCSACPHNTATQVVEGPCLCSEGYTITEEDDTVTCICCTCAPGYYRNEVSQCVPCVAGTFKSAQGDDLCTACPSGTTSGDGALSCTQPPVRLHTYPATSNTAEEPLTRPLVLCNGLKQATELAMSKKDGGLVENECLAIDACNHRVYRVRDDDTYHWEDIASLTAEGWSPWHWRGDPQFAFSGVDLEYRTNPPTSDLYNMYNIEYARIPVGVELETCQTNFTHLRSEGVKKCSLETERKFVGSCEYDSVPDSASLDCVTAVQHNAIYGGIGTDLQAWYDPAPVGTTQLFRYRIAQNYLCHDDGLPAAGRQFASAESIYPRASIPCAPVQNGHYETAGSCTVTCNSMHTYVQSEQGVSSCEHVCSSYVETSCEPDEIRLSMCEFEGVEAFQCARCDAKAGQNFLGVTQDPTGTCTVTDNVKTCSYADTCDYEDCAVGSSNPGTSLYCTNCPVNTFAAAVRSSACTPCVVDNGEYQPSEGQAGCISCLRTPSTPNPCAAGLIFHNTKPDIDAFFEDPVNAALTPWWEKYCEDGHACLPCPPGTHEVRNGDTGTCEPCAKGTFSNNFGQSVCMTCGDGMTTVSTGSDDATACVCLEGHGV